VGHSRATDPSLAPGRSFLPVSDDSPSSFVVGTFNVHAGVDGWGRPFDVVGACVAIDADVLVLQESWWPQDAPGIVDRVAEAMGYTVLQHTLATGRLAAPDPRANSRWMRSLDWRGASHAIILDSERPFGERMRSSVRYRTAHPGRWGLAVLSRLPVTAWRVFELGRLPRDRAQRVALVATLQIGGVPVTIVGTHMSHITYGAARHFLRLGRHLRDSVGTGPAVLAGDMNMWGPPVSLLLPDWTRALRSKTWPAWRPHSHVDHILVRGPLTTVAAEVLPAAGSDHLPVRVRLAVGPVAGSGTSTTTAAGAPAVAPGGQHHGGDAHAR
jgi:endonuclease/exonuclease/phosphatase family metal-dependent hydrolase